MRKQHLFSLLTLLFLSVNCYAQENVIIYDYVGKVEYFPDRQSQPTEVKERGGDLPPKGFINVVDGATVKLLLNGQLEVLDKGGTYDLESLLREKGQRRQLSLIGRFWRFVTEGVMSAESEESLERHHEQYMSRAGGIKGWAKGEYGLAANLLIRDKLAGGQVTFDWNTEKKVEIYDLYIYRQSDDLLVFKATTQDTVFTVDFDQLYLEPATSYYWMVTPQQERNELPNATTAPAQRSAALYFSYEPEGVESALSFPSEAPAYVEASEVEKMLIEAYTLENDGLFYEAGQRYERLQKMYPDDVLLKKLHASFLARQGTLEKAVNLID